MDAETELPSPREPPARLRPVAVAVEAWKTLAEQWDVLATLAALGFVPVLLSILWDSLLLELLGLAGVVAALTSWAVFGLGWATGAYVASHWHRLLLLGREDVRATLPRWTQAETRLFWWYLGFCLLSWLVGSVLLFAAALLSIPLDGLLALDPWGLRLFMAVLSLGWIYVMLRASLAIPAAAVAGPGRGFTDSWKATDGNGWRLVAATVLALLPLAPPFALGVHWMVLGGLVAAAGAPLLAASEIALLMVLAGVLSLAYRLLVLLGGPVPLLSQDEEDRPDPAAEAGVRSLAPRARLLEEPVEEDETPPAVRF